MPDAVTRLLAELPQAEADGGRSERTRVRCRTRLVRLAARAQRVSDPASPTGISRLLEPTIVVLGAVYLTGVLIEALRLYRALLE